jgi:hypothetical protein
VLAMPMSEMSTARANNCRARVVELRQHERLAIDAKQTTHGMYGGRAKRS